MKNALIVGAGAGLSASLARLFRREGLDVSLAARRPDKLSALCEDTGARAYGCDAVDPESVSVLFEALDKDGRTPELFVYNAGSRVPGAIETLDATEVRDVILSNAYGAFLTAQQAAIRMQNAGKGVMLFTGASAAVKGYAKSSPFAMGKFALRGLCQSLARELAPQNIHVAHFVIDGVIYSKDRGAPYDNPDISLNPDEIAKTYLAIAQQDKSAWTWEIELRPFVEKF